MANVNKIDIEGEQWDIEDTTARKILTYSLSETATGKTWVNGKPIYRKVVDFGKLPDITTKEVPHGISNAEYFTSITATAYRQSDNMAIPIPFLFPALENNIFLYVIGSVIRITTGSDRWAIDQCYVFLEYTKTTD